LRSPVSTPAARSIARTPSLPRAAARSRPLWGTFTRTNTTFTNYDYYAQQLEIWQAISEMAVRLNDDIRAGIFDDDAQATPEAEKLLTETENFYGDLLTA